MSDAETPHDDFFVFRIFKRTGSFGETAAQESDEVGRLLRAAEQMIRSGVPLDQPEQRQVKCRSGHTVAQFEFGPGMVRGPGPGFDGTHYRLPSAMELANAPRRIDI
jgi:hypothetical protein